MCGSKDQQDFNCWSLKTFEGVEANLRRPLPLHYTHKRQGKKKCCGIIWVKFLQRILDLFYITWYNQKKKFTQTPGKKGRRKARKTDASDLTPNPQKLHNIGEQLQKLNAAIDGMGPVNELPAVARARSRKEKNKLASRYSGADSLNVPAFDVNKFGFEKLSVPLLMCTGWRSSWILRLWWKDVPSHYFYLVYHAQIESSVFFFFFYVSQFHSEMN